MQCGYYLRSSGNDGEGEAVVVDQEIVVLSRSRRIDVHGYKLQPFSPFFFFLDNDSYDKVI